MNVVDAGVIVELLVGALDPAALDTEELAVPHLLDSEVTHVLRTLVLRRTLTERQTADALEGFIALQLTRYPAHTLRPRMWELRHNLTAYDATYVALAEQLAATALLTTDARLARTAGARCTVRVL